MFYFCNCLVYQLFCFTFSEKLKEFKDFVMEDAETQQKISALKEEVIAFAQTYSMPGFDEK